MKVAHVNADPGISPSRKKGAAVHVTAMREAFAELGCEVVAIDATNDGEVADALSRASGIDVVYERYALGRYSGGERARALGAAHVLEVNAPLAEEEELYRGGRTFATDHDAERALFARATLVLAVSSAVARYAIDRGAAYDRVLVRPNGVDARRFRPRELSDDVRARLVPAGRVALGFHGRLRPWHNVELLVDATAALVESGRDVQLVFLGEGEFESAWRGRIDAGRVSSVAWLPHDEAARVVAAFDVLPLTYAKDAPCWFSPLKLAEAMACGAVPVAPELGDLPTEITHERDGLLYPPGDREALVAALARLVDDGALRSRLGANAHARAQARSWCAIARDVLERCAVQRSPR